MTKHSPDMGSPSRHTSHGQVHRRLVDLLAGQDAFGRIDGARVIVFARPGKVTLRVGSAPAAAARDLVSSGAAVMEPRSGGAVVRLTEAGHSLARRLQSADPSTGFLAQHVELVRLAPGGSPQEARTVNASESPLLWLYRRKGRDGVALVGDAEFAAGERLRSDLTLAAMMPRLTVDWERQPVAGGGAGLHASESMLAARQRVARALDAVGPEFSGLLMDICGFLKSIELIERERGWPARSAKVVLSLGLSRLARHYGLSNLARGVRQPGRPHHWGSDGYRPEFVGAAVAEAQANA